MRRLLFLIPLLMLVLVPCITISAHVHAQAVTRLLFENDFEDGLDGFQLKHLLSKDQIRCKDDNCFFRWTDSATLQNRTLQATVQHPGKAGERISAAGTFDVSTGAVLILRLNIPGQKTRCKRIIRATTRFETFTCESITGVDFDEIRLKISTMGGGTVKADDISISVSNDLVKLPA